MFGIDSKRTLQKSQWMWEKEKKKIHTKLYMYIEFRKNYLLREFSSYVNAFLNFFWIELKSYAKRWSSVYIFICKSYSNVCRHIDNVNSNEKRRSSGLFSANEMRIWGERTFRSNEIGWNKWKRFFFFHSYWFLLPQREKRAKKKPNSNCCNMLVCNNTEFNWIPELWYAESACNRMKMR